MGDQVLLDEIDDLKELCDNLKQELSESKDSADAEIEGLQAECEVIKDKTAAEWKMRLKAADREARERSDLVMLELEMMRQAFSGDVGGWKLVEGAKGDYYENEDTGEKRQEEPEVMYVARSMKACEEAKELIEETEALRAEVVKLRKAEKSMTLAVNKAKTEANSLLKQDKAWKEASKTVFNSMKNVKAVLDGQVDQIMDGLDGCSLASRRCHFMAPKVKEAQNKYAEMQTRVNSQEQESMKQMAEIRHLTTQLESATERVNRLSNGLDEEVERLVKPIREKMADSMMMVMKEKANRAQERREFANSWPDGYLLPTVLMQYRCLSDEERKRRIDKFHANNANMALSIEIRANVVEKTKWEMKYDDYGREFYQHMDTGEKSDDQPAIMNYKPPEGRDEEGNVVIDQVKMNQWKMLADSKGEVYYEHIKTKEKTYTSPNAYGKIPKGKSKSVLAAEGAETVLLYIRYKIGKHIRQKKREKKKLAKAKDELVERERLAAGGDPDEKPASEITEDEGETSEEDEDDGIASDDLSKYMFDIETVEMLAGRIKKAQKMEPELDEKRDNMVEFLVDSDARKFDMKYYDGPSLLDTDPTDMSVEDLRRVIEDLAKKEEILDKRLSRTRVNMNDFSYLLLERAQAADLARIQAEREEKELLRKEALKVARKEARREARRKQRELEKMIAEQKQDTNTGGTIEQVGDPVLEGEVAESKDGDNNSALDAKNSEVKDDKAEEDKEGGDNSLKEEEKKTDVQPTDEAKVGLVAEVKEETKIDAKDSKVTFSEEKSESAPPLQGDIGGASLAGESLDLSLDEDYETDEDEDFEDLDNQTHTSELTSAGLDNIHDPDVLIYGDVSLDPSDVAFPEDIMLTSKNLINFAVFCGYSNMFIEEAPEDANYEFSLRPEDFEEEVKDDKWLTSSFFVSLTKDRVDAVRELVGKVYDPDLGLLDSSPLSSIRLTRAAEQMAHGRKVSEPYTPYVHKVNENLTTAHAVWKAGQMMTEVVRFQCQKSAVRDAFQSRFKNYAYEIGERRNSMMSLMSEVPRAAIAAREKPVMLKVKKVTATNVSAKTWADQQAQFVEISIGGWSVRTPPIIATGRPLVWEKLGIAALIPLVRIQLDDVLIEAYDDHDLRPSSLLATSRKSCGATLLGYNTGNDVILTFEMRDRNKSRSGTVEIVFNADMHTETEDELNNDPDNLENTEINLITSEVDKSIPVPLLANPGTAINSAEETEIAAPRGVVQLVRTARSELTTEEQLEVPLEDNGNLDPLSNNRENEVRVESRLAHGNSLGPNGEIDPRFDHPNAEGDPNYLRSRKSHEDGASLHGSLQTKEEDLLSGYHQSLADQQSSFEDMVADLRGDGTSFMQMFTGDFTFKDIKRTGHRVGPSSSARLPNFKKTTAYLSKKTTIFMAERENYLAQTETHYETLKPIFKSQLVRTREEMEEAQKGHKKVLDAATDTQRKVKDVGNKLEDLRNPAKKPKEPILPDLADVAYVEKIPEKGATDEKGKKKKQIPNRDIKEILDHIFEGNLDAKEWDFGKYWPSQAQAIKINKAMGERNAVLDAQRAEVNEGRNKLMNRYYDEIKTWEVDEKKRKVNFDKMKKQSRKSNLKLDCYMERADRRNQVMKIAEKVYNAVKELNDLHVNSKTRVKTLRTKCYLEAERQRNTITKLRKKMLKCLDARRRAFELPRGATNPVQFEEFRGKAEEALRTLRLEILETKQLLVQEGVRMRTAQYEEISILRNEYLRASLTIEALKQNEDLNKLLTKNQYEVLHLMEAMEKLRLIEADKDDRGLRDTVDNLGERYIPGKKFKSQEIDQCQNLIDLVMEKINLIEGVASSSGSSLHYLADAICSKWGAEFTSVRDSWVENSDYERSSRLCHDVVQWVTIQRKKLGEQQKMAEKEAEELRMQVAASDEQAELMLRNQDNDTKFVTESALQIVNVMQEHISEIREEANENKRLLDAQVTDVTRECQKLREELILAKQSSDQKTKLLWSVIATLQTAAQSLSSRMDIVIEERDRIVLASKLESDKMKHQLRQERKHSANLLFIVHSQRGSVRYLHDVVKLYTQKAEQDANARKLERAILRKEIWEQIFAFTRLSTDVDALFEFFSSRLANLAGARKNINNQLASNGAAMVLAALCKSPRPLIRKFASRALGSMGWDGYVETRVLLWDCVVYWKSFKNSIINREKEAYKSGFETFKDTGKFEALLNIGGTVEEFVPSGNMSLRTIIKQRRQWALRATRRVEGPNVANQKLINVREGIIPALLQLCLQDGDDWEVAKNAALAISIASYEMSNHAEMTNSQECIKMLLRMCSSDDAEVQTHAAVTVANLCHRDENAQAIFGNSDAIPVLINMCTSLVVDVLEAATCALANITCFCDPNCDRVMESGGVEVMVDLVAEAYSENLLDLDQNDEVQANAMEMLANVSRVNGAFTSKFFNNKVINAIILMCAAVNIQVKRHAPLVLGNIGQSQECRELIGELGGIEALFLVYEEDDETIKANTLWALCNLMWHPANQERAGRFMGEIFGALAVDYMPIKINGAILLANALYYNNSNRVRFLETDGAMDTIMQFIAAKEDKTFVESALRALLSLSYLDNVALWLGEEGDAIPLLIEYMKPPYISREAMRYSLETLANLCVHHSNRSKVLELEGIVTIISLSTDPDHYIQDLQAQVVGYLEDVTPAEVLAKAKMDIGLERMVVLASNSDPMVRAVAAESIGEEIWHKPELQKRALEIGGLEVLLSIVSREDESVTSLLPALWSLRNMLHDSVEAQTQVSHRDGLGALVACVQRCASGNYADQTEKIIEAALACITASISNHERNSRRLLVIGLEAMMDLADGKMGSIAGAEPIVKAGMRGEGVIALAKSILLMLGPYNYVVCRNCNKKQDLIGQSCFKCGYRLRMETTDAGDRGSLWKGVPDTNKKGKNSNSKVLLGSQSTTNLSKMNPLKNGKITDTMSRTMDGLPAKETKENL